MHALIVSEQKPPTLDLVERPEPLCPPGGAIVRITGCGLCGSDVDKLLNRTPPSGTVLGHEAVGVIEQFSGETQGFTLNQRVVMAHHVPCGHCRYCRGGSESMCEAFKRSNFTPGAWADKIALTEGHLRHTTFAIPNGISDATAHAVEPLACVIKAIDKARAVLPQAENALVIGLGFVGLLATQVLEQQGLVTAGVDLSQSRRDFARTHQLCAHVGGPETSLPELNLPKEGADLVFLSVVSQASIAFALKHVRNGGVILLFASPAQADQARLDPYPLYFREIQVLSSYSPSLSSLQRAADLIFSGQILTEPLVTHTVPFSEAMTALEAYRNGEAIKVLLQPESTSG